MQMRFSASEQSETWERFEAGESMRSIARSIGRSQAAVRGLIQKTGGIRPLAPTGVVRRQDVTGEREEISRGLASGLSMRQVAAGLGRLGRAPSTVSRECPPTAADIATGRVTPRLRPRRRARRTETGQVGPVPEASPCGGGQTGKALVPSADRRLVA